MTNFEKIRNMSVEELKLWINKNKICDRRDLDECMSCGDCDECLVEWLNEEAKD